MLYIFFFFFKQKTAYEMRISDWSSDVCSSDLGAGFIVTPAEAHTLGLGNDSGLAEHIRPYRNGRDLAARARGVMVIDLYPLQEVGVSNSLDRKSVVQGKSGSVRLNLGCCRTIKKKRSVSERHHISTHCI